MVEVSKEFLESVCAIWENIDEVNPAKITMDNWIHFCSLTEYATGLAKQYLDGE